MDIVAIINVGILNLLVVGMGIYLVSYLRAKGRNLATREDLEKITKATEEIKAQISGDLWVRQRRRELQLEVLNKVNGLLAEFLVVEVHRPQDLSAIEIAWMKDHGVEAIPHPFDVSLERIRNWKKYVDTIDSLTVRWFALTALLGPLFSDRVNASVEDVTEILGPKLNGRSIAEFRECRDTLIRAIVEETCA